LRILSPNQPNSELTSVIVDGENAWEFYLNGGYEFWSFSIADLGRRW